jgi:uncharacterized protein YdhG (YjbR/CyaY superfamily)
MPAADIDEFLADLPADQRSALQRLRGQIRRAAPEATEAIAYGVPALKLDGRPFVSLGAAKGHCSFYVQSPAVIEAHADELGAYRLTKGSIGFQPDRDLPDELVTKLVRARSAEIRATSAAR